MAEKRVIAVLGFSGRSHGLHPICAERLAHAHAVADGADAVILSGWAPRRRARSEAELMHEAWAAADVRVVRDPDARSTAENAANIVAAARELGADEVVVVTSRWHRPRARLLMRAAARGTGLRVVVDAPRGRRPLRLVARELACLPVLPLQLRRAQARRPAPRLTR